MKKILKLTTLISFLFISACSSVPWEAQIVIPQGDSKAVLDLSSSRNGTVTVTSPTTKITVVTPPISNEVPVITPAK